MPGVYVPIRRRVKALPVQFPDDHAVVSHETCPYRRWRRARYRRFRGPLKSTEGADFGQTWHGRVPPSQLTRAMRGIGGW
jgi:hypothetical protein